MTFVMQFSFQCLCTFSSQCVLLITLRHSATVVSRDVFEYLTAAWELERHVGLGVCDHNERTEVLHSLLDSPLLLSYPGSNASLPTPLELVRFGGSLMRAPKLNIQL